MTAFLIKEDFIEVMFGQQRVRLYIIAGVKNDTAFAPLTKKEISVCIHSPFFYQFKVDPLYLMPIRFKTFSALISTFFINIYDVYAALKCVDWYAC